MNLAEKYRQVLQDAFNGDDSDSYPKDEKLIWSEEDVADQQVARGDTLLDEGDEAKLKSELPGVSDECWTQFVRAMATQKPDEVSPSNGVGMFALTPRRLADLGLVKNLTRKKAPSGRMVYTAIFIAPLTSDKFLNSPQIQYRVLCASVKKYADQMDSGEIEKDPDMSKAGALAILHRAGPNGLNTWENGERFPATQDAVDRVDGLF